MTTELNSLANGAYAIASAAYDNTGNLDLFADFAAEFTYTTSTPAAGTKVAELYIVPSIDGTHFASIDASNVCQKALLVATFETRLPSTTVLEYLLAMGIPLPPRKFKTIIKNTSGQTLGATGNLLVMGPFQIQNA
jgi:hypothetical protein